jgi:hypothetical protein
MLRQALRDPQFRPAKVDGRSSHARRQGRPQLCRPVRFPAPQLHCAISTSGRTDPGREGARRHADRHLRLGEPWQGLVPPLPLPSRPRSRRFAVVDQPHRHPLPGTGAIDLPPGARELPLGRTLAQMLLAAELDAIHNPRDPLSIIWCAARSSAFSQRQGPLSTPTFVQPAPFRRSTSSSSAAPRRRGISGPRKTSPKPSLNATKSSGQHSANSPTQCPGWRPSLTRLCHSLRPPSRRLCLAWASSPLANTPCIACGPRNPRQDKSLRDHRAVLCSATICVRGERQSG